jgi:alpha-mannosidase
MESDPPMVKEVLVLHHSHLDVGYTHSQPVVGELQREYIDLALDMLDATSAWPEQSRPRWTCEVTAPVLQWLETATEADTARFTRSVQDGRLGIGALLYNMTSLNSADQLSRQLAPVASLRRRLGAAITTAVQHDVNGVPWPLADLLLDHGVELLVMGVNRHLGGTVRPRPAVFRWQTPSGREIRVMNGNHYTMFDQILLTWERSLDSMQRGLAEYAEHLRRIDYAHDFLYLTTTASPEMWDNSPPNLPVAELIRQWNESGRQPPIRYVTTEGLLERIRLIPSDQLPLLSGDWTDYWTFGSASTAAHVAVSRAAKRALGCAERISGAARSRAASRVDGRVRDLLDLFNEHTWSHWDTLGRGEPALVQDHLKAAMAIEASELAGWVLVNELEKLAGNPVQSEAGPDGVLLVNPSPLPRSEYVDIPAAWRRPGPRLRCQRFMTDAPGETETCGPIELPAFGSRIVSLADLIPAGDDPRIRHEDRRSPVAFRAFNNVRIETARHGDAVLESPAHRLTFDPVTGRVLGLLDRTSGWEVIPATSDYGFFDFVRERPDALVDGRREAWYERNLDEEKFDRSCWKPWRAVRERATRVRECRVVRTPCAVILDRSFEAPGTLGLRQRISLRADSPVISIEIELQKAGGTDPEGIYFVVPLRLPPGWRCHFDTAGLAVELDAEQLPGASRGWFAVESFVTIHGDQLGATLFCPDAPMAMAGGFNFGPPLETVPREADPLLLAWPMNNYWNTNFPLEQPGIVRLRYGLQTHARFDPIDVRQRASAFANPIIAHPAFRRAKP